jgi:hypothetical protein
VYWRVEGTPLRYFCTLFDKHYLYQGLALFQSLEANCSRDFTLYALCLDDVAYDLIKRIAKANLVPISLANIETDESRAVKQRVTRGQYCAVWQPLLCLHILDAYKVDLITYVDADILFFNDPEMLFKELDDCSASVVPHRFPPGRDQSAVSGKFCVQFNAFGNNRKSRDVLQYWKECCFEYSLHKPTYYPGQLSLDRWPEKFEGVRVIQHLGAGVAPWNVQQYEISNNNGRVMVNGTPLVFYHYHEYAWEKDGTPFLSSYSLPGSAVKYIYQPYTAILREIEEWVQSLDATFRYKRTVQTPNVAGRRVGGILNRIRRYLRKILRPR